jgi:hypothetical protein
MESPNSEKKTPSTLDEPESEAALGGADAVNDTSGLASQGTTPASPFRVLAPTGRVGSGNKLVWLAVIVAIGIIAAYAAGMLR